MNGRLVFVAVFGSSIVATFLTGCGPYTAEQQACADRMGQVALLDGVAPVTVQDWSGNSAYVTVHGRLGAGSEGWVSCPRLSSVPSAGGPEQ